MIQSRAREIETDRVFADSFDLVVGVTIAEDRLELILWYGCTMLAPRRMVGWVETDGGAHGKYRHQTSCHIRHARKGLQRDKYEGYVAPSLVSGQAQPCPPSVFACRGLCEKYHDSRLGELLALPRVLGVA
jgi:hypothetical protein